MTHSETAEQQVVQKEDSPFDTGAGIIGALSKSPQDSKTIAEHKKKNNWFVLIDDGDETKFNLFNFGGLHT